MRTPNLQALQVHILALAPWACKDCNKDITPSCRVGHLTVNNSFYSLPHMGSSNLRGIWDHANQATWIGGRKNGGLGCCPESGVRIKTNHLTAITVPLVFPWFSSVSDTVGFQMHTSSKCLCRTFLKLPFQFLLLWANAPTAELPPLLMLQICIHIQIHLLDIFS